MNYIKFQSVILITLILTADACKDAKQGDKSHKSAVKGTYQINNLYYLDTTIIIKNWNLENLLARIKKERLENFDSKEKIPSMVFKFLNQLSYSKVFEIANPDEPWQNDDIVISGEKRPNRKLIYLGCDNNFCLFIYDLGGVAVSRKVLLFEFDERSILDFWAGVIPNNINDKNSVLEYISSKKNEPFLLNTNQLVL